MVLPEAGSFQCRATSATAIVLLLLDLYTKLTNLNRVFHLAIIVAHLQNTLQSTSTSEFQDAT